MPNNFSILIVEDDADVRSNMEDLLSLDGYKVKSVSHCLPAINAIETESFDAVIVDWRLPDGNGGELLPLVKRAQPNAPVIVVTGVRDFDTPVEALRSGAYDFMSKPINPDVLRSVLDRLVERKKHMVDIEVAQDKLVSNERLAAIGQMVAGLAHESRNAFQRSHACLAELTLDLEEMPDSLKLVHKVQKALDDIHRLLEEVRGYSASIILERRICDVAGLVKETWKQIVDAKQLENVPEIEFNQSSDFPPNWFIDGDRISQVIRNLLENALFASGQQGKIQVNLDFVRDKREVIRIEVSDDGAGVPAENREKIFTPFFTTKTKGTGLGLAICRRIVAAHNGRLVVKDSELGGARFVLELPKKTK